MIAKGEVQYKAVRFCPDRAPYLSDLVRSLDDLRDLNEVIERLVCEGHPTLYPGFEFMPQSMKEERARVRALRKFVFDKVESLLFLQCACLGHKGRYPTRLILSAVVDVLSHLKEDDLVAITHLAYSQADIRSALGKRLTLRKKLEQRARCNRTSLREEAGKEFDVVTHEGRTPYNKSLGKFPKPCDQPFQVIAKEIRAWTQEHVKWVRSVLMDMARLDSTIFSDGTLLEKNLPPQLRIKLESGGLQSVERATERAAERGVDTAIERGRIKATKVRTLRGSEITERRVRLEMQKEAKALKAEGTFNLKEHVDKTWSKLKQILGERAPKKRTVKNWFLPKALNEFDERETS